MPLSPGDPSSEVRDGEDTVGMTSSRCLFCRIVAGEAPAHEVLRTETVVAFLDIRPVFPGHVLVVPAEHVDTLPDLSAEKLPDYMGTVQRIARVVPETMGAQGTFVAVNNVVSQSVPHLHTHVVPRTRSDGLRGFFWPRTTYAEGEAAATAARIAAALRNTRR